MACGRVSPTESGIVTLSGHFPKELSMRFKLKGETEWHTADAQGNYRLAGVKVPYDVQLDVGQATVLLEGMTSSRLESALSDNLEELTAISSKSRQIFCDLSGHLPSKTLRVYVAGTLFAQEINDSPYRIPSYGTPQKVHAFAVGDSDRSTALPTAYPSYGQADVTAGTEEGQFKSQVNLNRIENGKIQGNISGIPTGRAASVSLAYRGSGDAIGFFFGSNMLEGSRFEFVTPKTKQGDLSVAVGFWDDVRQDRVVQIHNRVDPDATFDAVLPQTPQILRPLTGRLAKNSEFAWEGPKGIHLALIEMSSTTEYKAIWVLTRNNSFSLADWDVQLPKLEKASWSVARFSGSNRDNFDNLIALYLSFVYGGQVSRGVFDPALVELAASKNVTLDPPL